eukprot:m.76935 g.76935  ORF g.76935 m.76935 type:complete len:310 (+) comp24955_c1_seq1:643-1572(+)
MEQHNGCLNDRQVALVNSRFHAINALNLDSSWVTVTNRGAEIVLTDKLKELNLSMMIRSRYNDSDSSTFLQQVALRSPNLTCLRLNRNLVSSEDVMAILKQCRNLRVVNLEDCFKSHDQFSLVALRRVGTLCPFLEELSIALTTSAAAIRDTTTLISLHNPESPWFKRLKSLKISGYSVTDAGLGTVLRELPHLQTLHLHCRLLSGIAFRQIAVTNQLHTLRIRRGAKLTGEGLREAGLRCPRLRCLDLDLGDHTSFTDADLVRAVASCTHLTNLKITNAPSITSKSLDAITSTCSSLVEVKTSNCPKV